MRSTEGFLPPTNEFFTGDKNNKQNKKLFYKCRKCKKRIWAHVLNEHLRFCGLKKSIYVPPTETDSDPTEKVPKRKVRLVNKTIRSKRYNKTKYK